MSTEPAPIESPRRHGQTRPGAVPRGRGGSARARAWWVRLFALAVLLLAAPGTADLAREAVAYAADGDCCSDGRCAEEPGTPCPRPCVHCACCIHPGALPLAAHPLTLVPPSIEHEFGWSVPGAQGGGYRAPPYRPPAV